MGATLDAGIAHDNVYRTQLSFNLAHHGFTAAGRACRRQSAWRARQMFAQVGDDGLDLLRIAEAIQHDVSAGCRKLRRNSETDA